MPKIVLGHLPFVRTSQPDHYRTGYFDNEIGIFPRVFAEEPGADAGFFLGGGALVSCSTSTPINHSFFCRIAVLLENRRSSQGGGGAHSLHPPPRSAPAGTLISFT